MGREDPLLPIDPAVLDQMRDEMARQMEIDPSEIVVAHVSHDREGVDLERLDYLLQHARQKVLGADSRAQRADARWALIEAMPAALEEIRTLRSELEQLDAICQQMRRQYQPPLCEELGMWIGGTLCEHPCVTGRRCDACGAVRP